MSSITTFFTELRNDEDGASFLEYTVLLGIILAVSIVVLTTVGGYATDIWNDMRGTVQQACEDATASMTNKDCDGTAPTY